MPQRGRAASPIRPGLICKQVLQGILPLESGEQVSECAIVDLYGAYKTFLYSYNQLRPRAKPIHGMSHHSFYTMFKFAQLLNLVELVREEPMLFPPPHGSLYNPVRSLETNRIHTIKTVRRIFKLSAVGREDEKSWLDLTNAWKEQWPAPQKVEALPSLSLIAAPEEKPAEGEKLKVPAEKIKGKRGRKPGVAVKPVEILPEAPIPEFKWVTKPSQKQYNRLLRHLRILTKLDQAREDVIKHIDDLTSRIGDWAVEMDDALEDAKAASNLKLVSRLTHEKTLINDVFEGLMDRDLDRAVTALNELTKK
jgi:hypothetical protein